MSFLIEQGCSVMAVGKNKQSALHTVARAQLGSEEQSLKVLKVLLSHPFSLKAEDDVSTLFRFFSPH
eukprot:m.60305 g.60305  ORF g.60305 m.60305 type:complete len:67 (+) comp34925_c1_seq19:1625-1825(+)